MVWIKVLINAFFGPPWNVTSLQMLQQWSALPAQGQKSTNIWTTYCVLLEKESLRTKGNSGKGRRLTQQQQHLSHHMVEKLFLPQVAFYCFSSFSPYLPTQTFPIHHYCWEKTLAKTPAGKGRTDTMFIFSQW